MTHLEIEVASGHIDLVPDPVIVPDQLIEDYKTKKGDVRGISGSTLDAEQIGALFQNRAILETKVPIQTEGIFSPFTNFIMGINGRLHRPVNPEDSSKE